MEVVVHGPLLRDVGLGMDVEMAPAHASPGSGSGSGSAGSDLGDSCRALGWRRAFFKRMGPKRMFPMMIAIPSTTTSSPISGKDSSRTSSKAQGHASLGEEPSPGPGPHHHGGSGPPGPQAGSPEGEEGPGQEEHGGGKPEGADGLEVQARTGDGEEEGEDHDRHRLDARGSSCPRPATGSR